MKKYQRLIDLIKKHAYKEGDFTLSSGMKSDYFIDMSQLLYLSEGAHSISRNILQLILIQGWPINVIGGPAYGAAPIVGAVLAEHARDYLGTNVHMNGFLVRKEFKSNSESLIEGILKPGDNVLIVEDVITTGTQVKKTYDLIESLGANVHAVVAVVDRLQGAKDLFKGKLHSLVTIDDLR